MKTINLDYNILNGMDVDENYLLKMLPESVEIDVDDNVEVELSENIEIYIYDVGSTYAPYGQWITNADVDFNEERHHLKRRHNNEDLHVCFKGDDEEGDEENRQMAFEYVIDEYSDSYASIITDLLERKYKE